MIAWTCFVNPICISPGWVLWLMLPLCLSVAVVYKTVRTKYLQHMPLQVAVLMVYIVGGLVLLGAALWGLQMIFL